MRLGIVRLQFQRPAVAGDRFVQLPLVLQRIAQVVVRLGIVRLQFQCPAVAGDRFGNPAQGTIRFPQVVVEGSHIPFQPDRPSDVLDGDLVLAHLVGNHAEKMPRIGMIRLGLRESAGRSARRLAAGRLDGAGSQSPMLRKSLP